MINKLKKFFSKSEDENTLHLPKNENVTFILTIDDIEVGVLHCERGIWEFKYSDEFKTHSNEYTRIVGFPDLDKVYQSDSLWPFFSIRIPGLKQPAVQEVIKMENIDQDNEVALLKRFGKRTISNPYELVLG